MSRPDVYEKEGWEFCRRDCGLSNIHSHAEIGVLLPMWYSQLEFCIKHRDSGVTFRFHPYDAFLKLEEEKTSRGLLPSSFPSYGSPLRRVVDHEFDCAYVGDVVIEKPGEERQSYCASWEDIDWKTLHEQIDWITANEKISRLPITGKFNERSASKRKYKKRGLIVNHMELFYDNNYPAKRGNGYCYFNLVVTDCGWFASLQQLVGGSNMHDFYLELYSICYPHDTDISIWCLKGLPRFGNCYGDGRIREMTMHCNFNQNAVYQEIIERQTKDFEKNINVVIDLSLFV